MEEETWVAVDGHGNEYAFPEKPHRDFPNMDLRMRWGQRWRIGTSVDPPIVRNGVKLPKGTIESLIGIALTYDNDPIQIEIEDYGIYVETRPEILNSDKNLDLPEEWR